MASRWGPKAGCRRLKSQEGFGGSLLPKLKQQLALQFWERVSPSLLWTNLEAGGSCTESRGH